MTDTNDPVNHPNHYKLGKVEVIDAIEEWQLDFHLGNAVKYIARAGKKDPAKYLEDLKKAQFYLNRKITGVETVKAKIDEPSQFDSATGRAVFLPGPVATNIQESELSRLATNWDKTRETSRNKRKPTR